MSLLLRSKLLDQATAKAKQRRFFVRGPRVESGAGRKTGPVMGKTDVGEPQPRGEGLDHRKLLLAQTWPRRPNRWESA